MKWLCGFIFFGIVFSLQANAQNSNLPDIQSYPTTQNRNLPEIKMYPTTLNRNLPDTKFYPTTSDEGLNNYPGNNNQIIAPSITPSVYWVIPENSKNFNGLYFGSGSSGGGQTTADGKLRDLQAPSSNQERYISHRSTGAGILYSLPTLKNSLQMFKNANLVFAQQLENELVSIQINFSKAPLQVLPSNDGIIIAGNNNFVQVAIRYGTNIYIDENEYKKLDETNKSFLILHELMHAFIKDDGEKIFNLRAFIGGFYSIYADYHELTAEEFNLLAQETQVQIYPPDKNRMKKILDLDSVGELVLDAVAASGRTGYELSDLKTIKAKGFIRTEMLLKASELCQKYGWTMSAMPRFKNADGQLFSVYDFFVDKISQVVSRR